VSTLADTPVDLSSIKVEVLNPETPFGGVQVFGAADQVPVQIEINTGSPVLSVFGRIGNILPLCGDYDQCYASRSAGVPAGGAVNQVLAKQSANDYDLRWVAQAAGVQSVFGRTGAVAAQAGDYSAFYQPLDPDLTSIAALTTTAFGRGFLPLADATAARTYIGAGTSSFDGAFNSLTGKPTTLAGYGITDAQPLDTDLTAIAALSTTAFGRGFLTQADAASSRTYIGAQAAGSYEPALGNPSTNGFILSSTIAGVRSWIAPPSGGGGTPGGSSGQVQFNSAGAFGGASGVTTNGNQLGVGGGFIGTNPLTVTVSSVGDGFAVGGPGISSQFSLWNGATQGSSYGLALSPGHFDVNVVVGDSVLRSTTGHLLLAAQVGGCGIKFGVNGSPGGSTIAMQLLATGVLSIGPGDVALGRSAGGVMEINNLTLGQYRDLKLRTLLFNPGAAPTGVEGALYGNSTDHKLYYHNGTTFVDLTLGGAGGGTVTSVSAGDLAPLFTTTEANPTTTPAISFALSTAAANTVFGNNTGSPAAPGFQSLVNAQLPTVTIAKGGTGQVTALAARGPSGLNVESRTTFSNANYTILAADNYVATTTTAFSAARTVTLPAANSLNAGERLYIGDDGGAINGTFTLLIARAGSDTIHGGTASIVLDVPRATVILESDGASNWTVISRSPALKVTYLTTGTTYTPTVGTKMMQIECIGGGGGGGGVKAGSSTSALGMGGGSGGYAQKTISGSAIKSSFTYAVGAGGTAGLSTGTNGGNGGDSTFDSPSICTATGGTGGTGDGTGGTAAGGITAASNPGFGTVGDYLTGGSPGGMAFRFSGTAGVCGAGGASVLGGGGRSFPTVAAGADANAKGAGGGGGVSFSATGQAGGAGGLGTIIVTEFF
jgi:hypothetical protein